MYILSLKPNIAMQLNHTIYANLNQEKIASDNKREPTKRH